MLLVRVAQNTESDKDHRMRFSHRVDAVQAWFIVYVTLSPFVLSQSDEAG
jgi:hypothetical protein